MDSILGGSEAAPTEAPVQEIVAEQPVQEVAPKWFEHEDIPEDLRGQLEKFPDPKENPYALATSYAHLEKKLGRNTIATIDENSSVEQRNEFFNTLGRPESADKYEIARAETLPEEFRNEEAQGAYLSKMHELGLTQAQAQGLIAFSDEFEVGNIEQMRAKQTAEQESQFNALKAEYGDKFNGFVEKVRMAETTLDPDGTLAEAGLANHPAVLKVLERAAQTYAPKAMVTDPASQNEGGLAAIENQISAIQNNPAYRTAGHPDQQRLINDMSMLAQKKVALQQA